MWQIPHEIVWGFRVRDFRSPILCSGYVFISDGETCTFLRYVISCIVGKQIRIVCCLERFLELYFSSFGVAYMHDLLF